MRGRSARPREARHDPPPDIALLEPSFGSRLVDGYYCGLGWYVARATPIWNANTIVLAADLTGYADFYDDEVEGEVLSADIADGVAILWVRVGECLWTPGCTDHIVFYEGDPCFEQRVGHAYDAVAGQATLRLEDDGSVSGVVTDLLLEGEDGEPAIAVAELTLPALPEWIE